jgi:hypothetical protein
VTRRALVLLLALVLPGVVAPLPAPAQQRVHFEGRVLWVSGNSMAIAVNDGPSVSVDLSDVPQGEYAGLEEGEWVVVTAQLSRDRRKVLGISVARYGGGFQAP